MAKGGASLEYSFGSQPKIFFQSEEDKQAQFYLFMPFIICLLFLNTHIKVHIIDGDNT